MREASKTLRAPTALERILRLKIAGLPRARLRHVVEVVEVLRPRAPRVAHLIEEVGADDVAAKPPAHGNAGVVSSLHAHRDLVYAANLERAVVKVRALRGEQREVVVIRRAAQERDDAGAAVGELHTEHARVEVDHPLEGAGE